MSAILPVYNSASTVGPAIDSVLSQDVSAGEVIVVDDGSTDGTAAILRGYGSRITWLKGEHRGPAAARNTGVENARGEYVAFLDADDLWMPGKLRKSIAALENNASASLAYTDFIAVDADGNRALSRPMQGSPSLDQLLRQGVAIFPSVVVARRDAFRLCGGFPENFSRAGFEDSYFGLLMREQGEFVHVPEPLSIYHQTPAHELAVKYASGYRTFVRLARARYGRRSRPLIRTARLFYSALLTAAAAHEFRQRRYAPATAQLLRAVRLGGITRLLRGALTKSPGCQAAVYAPLLSSSKLQAADRDVNPTNART